MSIYRRLNPRLLVQVGVGLGLLHWTNMFNISLTQVMHNYSNKRNIFILLKFVVVNGYLSDS